MLFLLVEMLLIVGLQYLRHEPCAEPGAGPGEAAGGVCCPDARGPGQVFPLRQASHPRQAPLREV